MTIHLARLLQLGCLVTASIIYLGCAIDIFRCWLFGLPPFSNRESVRNFTDTFRHLKPNENLQSYSLFRRMA